MRICCRETARHAGRLRRGHDRWHGAALRKTGSQAEAEFLGGPCRGQALAERRPVERRAQGGPSGVAGVSAARPEVRVSR